MILQKGSIKMKCGINIKRSLNFQAHTSLSLSHPPPPILPKKMKFAAFLQMELFAESLCDE